jgi:predicted PurR-regulated permease PerM
MPDQASSMAPDAAPGAIPDAARQQLQGGPAPHRTAARGWPIFAALVVIATIAYAVRFALLPFIIAAGIGFVLEPLVQALQRRTGMPRGLIATALYILLLALLGAGGYWLGLTFVRDLSQLAEQGPASIRTMLQGAIGADGVEIAGQRLTPETLTEDVLDGVKSLLGAGAVVRLGAMGVVGLLELVLTLVLIPYFLLSGPAIASSTLWLVPPERRGSVRRVLPRILPMLRRYLVGVACVVTFTAVAAYIGFGLVFHLPHALLLSVAVGFLEIIPSLGPATSFVLVGLTALLNEHSFGAAALLGTYAIALRLAIDNVVGPIVLGRAVDVPRVAVMLAFVCGAVLFGVVGLVLAVPVAACTKIVLDVYYSEPIAEPDHAAETRS